LEEIIWQMQKEEQTLKVMPPSFDGCFNVSAFIVQEEPTKKTEKIIDYLSRDFGYSASSIDDYLSCPLKFYFQHVIRLREKENLLNEPEGKDIGNFIHGFLDQMFRGFIDKNPLLDAQFEKKFFAAFETRFAEELQKRMGAEAFMLREIMLYRLKKFLENERSRKVKSVLSLEQGQPEGFIEFDARKFAFKYRIDRIDLLRDDSILVLDYKTGFSAKSPAGLVKLEAMELSRQGIRDNIHSFQLPIYCYFARHMFKDKPLNAALYNLRNLELSYFIDDSKLDTLKRTMELCLKALDFILAEIINPGVDFYPDNSDERGCQYCAFSTLCR
jgi:ATP-dependent helicase/nuclease subunit B